MNNKNNNRGFLGKFLKKTVYRAQTGSMRVVIAMALVIGILASLGQGVWTVVNNYASSYAQISVVYPEIADGKYPDGSRFSAYNLISEERIQSVLDAMQAEGKYTEYTAQELSEQFELYTYTQGSVAEDVSSLRSEGNNYSYFANEYRLTFTQPGGGEDYSAEFLTALMEVDQANIQTTYGGKESFTELMDVGDISGWDYGEQVNTYRTRIGVALQYLKSVNGKAGGFVSENTGKDLMELISRYEVLYSERMNQIQNFIEVSGLTKDKTGLLNTLNNRLEETRISNYKFSDETEINGFAMENYDQTFTENLIVVSTSNQVGLYQARPKTVFDAVVDSYNAAVENTVATQVQIDDLNRQIDLYEGVAGVSSADVDRLVEKCEQMIAAVEQEYSELNQISADTLEDYLTDINEEYISYKVKKTDVFSMELLTGAALTGLVAAVLVVVLYAVAAAVSDLIKVCVRKRKLIRMRTYRDKLNAVK